MHVTEKYSHLATIIFKFNHEEYFVFVPTSYDLFPYPKSNEIIFRKISKVVTVNIKRYL